MLIYMPVWNKSNQIKFIKGFLQPDSETQQATGECLKANPEENLISSHLFYLQSISLYHFKTRNIFKINASNNEKTKLKGSTGTEQQVENGWEISRLHNYSIC